MDIFCSEGHTSLKKKTIKNPETWFRYVFIKLHITLQPHEGFVFILLLIDFNIK